MDQKRILLLVGMLFGLLCVSLIGCQMFNQDGQTPTTPATGSLDIANCAQMEDGSTVVDGHQLNWVVSDWGSMPYGYWMYVELNEQDAAGKRPGENQIPVTLGNVVLSFSGLPGAVSHIVIGVKAVQDPQDETFTERGRFAVQNGSVSIPLDYGDLVSYFGVTHYSIWFQAVGGENGQGVVCGQIAVSGVMPSRQTVTLSKRICFGTNPVAPPAAPPALGGCISQVGFGLTAADIPAPDTFTTPYTGIFVYPDPTVCSGGPYNAVAVKIYAGVTVTLDEYLTNDGGATWILDHSEWETGPLDWRRSQCSYPANPNNGVAFCFPGSTP